MSLESRLAAFADRVADQFNTLSAALTSGLAGKLDSSDPSVTNARTPTAHKTTHATGGGDALSPSDIGAANATHSHAESDITGLSTDLAGKQPLDSDLTAFAALTPTNDDVVQRKAGAWTNRSMAQVKTDLALTKSDVGLGSVDNTADTAKPVSTAQQTALNAKQDTSAKGQASGYASLDGSAKVPIAQLPTGTSSSTVAIGNDARLSDARTPTAHKSTHATGGTDALSPSDIGAQPADSDLTTIAGLTATTDNFLQAKASAWASRTPTQVAADLVTPLSSSLQATSAKGAASGYASLDASTKVPIAQLPTGTSSTTVAVGNDSRLSDARTPTAHASSHATAGSDPISPASIGAVPTTRTVSAGTGLTGGGDLSADRTLTVAYGTSSTTACVGNDSRLSDARTPTAHKTTHATGGTDALSPADIGAATSGHTHSAPSTYSLGTTSGTVNADRANGSNQKLTANGAVTLGVSATGGVDGESVMVRVLAQTSARTITPATGIIGAKSIPAGHVGFFQFVYDSDRAAFINVGYGASG